MTRSELEKRARVLTRLHGVAIEMSTHHLMMLCEVAESMRDGEAIAAEAQRVREESTNVH